MNRILKDPLLHFLLIGAALFVGYGVLNPPASGSDHDPATIVVDEDALLEFLQFRSQRFNQQWAEKTLTGMTAEERTRLTEDFTRQEAMYREALKLGLDDNDYVIKRRLIRTLEFIATAGRQASDTELSEQDLRDAYESNLERYTDPPSVSFTHVYLSSRPDGRNARQAATELLNHLQSAGISFEDSGGFGERFLYQRNYVDRTQAEVASHFGPAFAERLFSLAADGELHEWTGPLQSSHGWHLLMLDRFSPTKTRPFQEVRAQIAGRLLEDRRRAAQEDFARDLLSVYTIDLETDENK